MEVTKVDVAARALVMIGASPISSFADDSTEGLVTNNIYEEIVAHHDESTVEAEEPESDFDYDEHETDTETHDEQPAQIEVEENTVSTIASNDSSDGDNHDNEEKVDIKPNDQQAENDSISADNKKE